jgi:hypothetical protein
MTMRTLQKKSMEHANHEKLHRINELTQCSVNIKHDPL